MNTFVRKAIPADGPAIVSLVLALAEYEKLDPPDNAARDRLLNDLFGLKPRLECYLGLVDDRAVGYAFVFETYSSFLALPTLYLEDLFVLSEFRKRRVGYLLFRTIVEEAHRRGCGRMEWTVLDWNTPAIDFYNRLHASHMREWQLYRLVRGDMERLLKQG
jgi:GNAT superfamily N-acetyltransferase